MMGVKRSDIWELITTTKLGFFPIKLPANGMTDLEYRLCIGVRATNYYRMKKAVDAFKGVPKIKIPDLTHYNNYEFVSIFGR